MLARKKCCHKTFVYRFFTNTKTEIWISSWFKANVELTSSFQAAIIRRWQSTSWYLSSLLLSLGSLVVNFLQILLFTMKMLSSTREEGIFHLFFLTSHKVHFRNVCVFRVLKRLNFTWMSFFSATFFFVCLFFHFSYFFIVFIHRWDSTAINWDIKKC